VARPTYVHIDPAALLHNVRRVGQCAPGKKIIAMVKANAYGCGLSAVVPELSGHVDMFGVACLEEAMAIRSLGSRSDCLLAQGVFSAGELHVVAEQRFQCVIHQKRQLQWILTTPLSSKIKVWVKVNSGMHRLGFDPNDVADIISALRRCPWIDDELVVMTHLACADEPLDSYNQMQIQCFNGLDLHGAHITRSIANSAAILAFPDTHADVVRPGIMLYGVSPFANQTGTELGLMPVMRLMSAVSAIHHYPPHARIGYGGTWQSDKSTIIGVVPVGYGDGYPRHIAAHTPTWVNGFIAPVVGRVSMDMMTIDLTDCPCVREGDSVELWGQHIPVETVAKSAGTIGYELLCQVSPRARGDG
jgi:alanine racemase